MIELEHLDVNVTLACNARCIACSHASPFSKPYWMEPEQMARDLVLIKGIVHFETIYMVGGEPTLHPKLNAFLALAKTSGVSAKVGVITNGRTIQKQGDTFWALIDRLRLSIYPGLDPAIVEFCREKCEAHKVAFEPMEFNEFYLQLKPEQDDGAESFAGCVWRKSCFTLHEGHFYLCPQSAFFPAKFMELPANVDGLPLAGITEARLQGFIDRQKPFEACRACTAGHGKTIPWQEAKTAGEWLKKSTI